MKSSSGEKNGGSISIGERNALTTGIILIVVLATTLCLNTVAAQRVNCRKFVFAPVCRGTAAKRGPLLLPPSDENDIYRVQERKPELIDNEYPVANVQENENKMGTFREMMQRQRRLYRQMDQQQKSESFDPSIYDY